MMLFRWRVAGRTSLAVLLAAACLAMAVRSQSLYGAPPSGSSSPARKTAADRTESRSKPFDAEKLLRAFRGKREDVRLKALEDIERLHLADATLSDALWRAI